MTTMLDRTDTELSLSLEVQIAAGYLDYLSDPQYANDTADRARSTTRLADIIAAANASEVRGPVVRGVGAEMMERLWAMGLDVGIGAEAPMPPEPAPVAEQGVMGLKEQ